MAEDDGRKYSNSELMKDFWRFLGPGKGRFVLATLLRMSGDVAWLYPPIALAGVITFFAAWKSGESLTPVFMLLGYWGIALVYRYSSHYAAKVMAWRVSERRSLDVQLMGMEQLFRLDMNWHEKENAGNKLKRIERGGQSIDKLVRIWISNLVEIGVNFVSILVIIATVDPIISLGFGVFIISFALLSIVLMRPATRAARAVNAKEEELNGLLFEGINNIRTAKVLGMTGPLQKIMAESAAGLYAKVRSRVNYFQFRAFAVGVYSNAFKVIGIIFIIFGIANGHYEIGFLILFNGYFNRVSESVSELSDVSQDIVTAKYGIHRLKEVLDVRGEHDQERGKAAFPKDWKKIELKNVSFSYGEHDVLDGITFTLNRGERLGVVGVSGAGKSTLFKLLLKENENYTGEILVDGTSLRDFKKSSYYEQAAVVLQETEVFNFSLKENITIANRAQAKKSAALGRALDIAHVTDFVKRLPGGIETLIGEKGIKLSGGERQRVGIARAVFKEPELLFLDEATSHLDLESEETIQDSLHTFFQDVTAVVIAHRLTTIKEMDRILLLEDGKILESGSFDELYAKQGRFYELWEKQRLG